MALAYHCRRDSSSQGKAPMLLRTFKLTERHDEARNPKNNLVLTLAFAFLGLTNGFVGAVPGGIRALLSF
jgi:hypothetical protein